MQLTLPITAIIQTFMMVIHSFHSIRTVSAMDANGCYEKGALWDDLGTWDDIEKALDSDPIYNTGYLNTDSDPVKSNIHIGEHCFIFHITVASGHTNGGHLFVTEMLRHIYDNCGHGGVQKVGQIENNVKIGTFWVKGDPQGSSDC
ncbi:hypothetical protein INS49_010715 [Diaporthe citri]|uniref:uncharacterized protein n=1 Tax=Diaporthe citri TaxID=83186 RepID=UPI001C813634|nr:uncharacterized protein INS49_010715 [Diaporthe citri]KAG6362484.1 hypothetical protein INS49_010715 [Diaporthe citri]